MTRRDITMIVPALLAAGNAEAAAQTLPSGVYVYEDLPVKPNPQNGNKGRAILDGLTHTGYAVEVHETELAPGMMPHAAHHHEHEEMVLLREGVLEVTIKGKTTRLTPGSVAYVASNEEHGW